MGNRKRKACVLIVLILIDFCRSLSPRNAPPPRNVPVTDGQTSTPAAGQMPIESYSIEKLESVALVDDADPLESSKIERSRLLVNYLSTVINKSSLSLKYSGIPFTCNESSKDAFQHRIAHVPIARQLYDVATAVLLVLGGCLDEAAQRLADIDDDIVDEDFLSDLVEWMTFSVDVLVPLSNNETHNREETFAGDSNLIDQRLEITSSELNILQARTNDKPIGTIQCQWVQTEVENFNMGMASEHASAQTGELSLVSAKLRCEELGSCSGIAEMYTTSGHYFRMITGNESTASTDTQLGRNVTIWIKDCREYVSNASETNSVRVRREAWNDEDDESSESDSDSLGNVTVFQDANFEGKSRFFTGAIDFVGNEWDDSISSFICQEECTVILYEHANFEGRQMAIENSSNFIGIKFNDIVSSLIVLPYSIRTLCYTFYDAVDYSGTATRMCGDNDFSIGQNWPMSIALECEECSVILYSDMSFAGAFKAYSQNVTNIDIEWHGTILSVQVRPWVLENYEGELEPCATLFRAENYQGQRVVASGMLATFGSEMNGQVSSIYCDGPCTLIAFENANFTGESRLFKGSQTHMRNAGLTMSSILVLRTELCVTLYEHCDMQGRAVRYCEDVSKLPATWDHHVSSISIECSHCSVIVYDEPNFTGRSSSFTGSGTVNVGRKWNDMIASVQIRPWHVVLDEETDDESFIILFEDANYHGRAKLLTGGLDHVGDQLNDRVSSVYCQGTCYFFAFEDVNGGGRSKAYRNSQPYMTDFNDQLSSIAVRLGDLCVTLYEDCDFRGEKVTYCNQISMLPPQWNDRVSSLTVDCEVCSVVVYEHGHYKGRQVTFSGRVANVGKDMNDKISSLKLIVREMMTDSKPRVDEGSSCVNAEEEKAYSVIQWIPFVSSVYSLATSIYYGAVGCHDAAKERAIDMAMDIGMDAVVALTGGALAGAALGIKTGAKLGVKAGVKSIMKYATAAVKNTVRAGIKTGMKVGSKSVIKDIGKSISSKLGGVRSLTRSLPETIKLQMRSATRGIARIGEDGVKKTFRRVGSGIRRLARQKFDDLASKAQKEIDINVKAKSQIDFDEAGWLQSDYTVLCRRRRMPNSANCRPDQGRIFDAMERALSDNRVVNSRNLFRVVNNGKDLPPSSIFDGVPINDPTKLLQIGPNELPQAVFRRLQFYTHFMDEYVAIKNGKQLVQHKHLIVNLNIGGEPFTFKLNDARDHQVYVSFLWRQFDKGSNIPHSYSRLIDILDDPPATRQQRAKAIIQGITDPHADWTTLGNQVFSAKQREAARELIVLTHVAECASPWQDLNTFNKLKRMTINQRKKAISRAAGTNMIETPGGVPGMDKLARSFLEKIDNGNTNTFKKAFNVNDGDYLIVRDGGKRKLKAWLYGDDNAVETRELSARARLMSIDSNRRRRRRNA